MENKIERDQGIHNILQSLKQHKMDGQPKPKKVNTSAKFAAEITNEEAGKSQSKIGDIKQALQIIDKKLGGALYKLIDLYYTLPKSQ